MKNKIFEKRKRNGIITSIIITSLMLLYGYTLYILATLEISEILQIIFVGLYCIFGVIILPILLFRLQFAIYNYLNKNIDIIEKQLSSDFKQIYINNDCFKKSGFTIGSKTIMYKAKLDDDCNIILKIENTDDVNNFLEKTVSDYDWFLSLFKFEE